MEESKELSLICCVIHDNEIFNTTLFQSFDEIFKIAQAFLKKYPIDTNWHELKEWRGDYDEIIVQFAKDYLKP